MLLGGTLSTLLLLTCSQGLFGISTANQALRCVYEDRAVPVGRLGDIGARLLCNQLALSAALITPQPEVIAASTLSVETTLSPFRKSGRPTWVRH